MTTHPWQFTPPFPPPRLRVAPDQSIGPDRGRLHFGISFQAPRQAPGRNPLDEGAASQRQAKSFVGHAILNGVNGGFQKVLRILYLNASGPMNPHDHDDSWGWVRELAQKSPN